MADSSSSNLLSNKELDIVVFGATGYTGTLISQYLIKEKQNNNFTLGLAARNLSKLKQKFGNVENESNVKFIEAYVDDFNSIVKLCSQTKILMNCCGPFALLGENVVKACIEANTHYCDITGEPSYINKIASKYHEEAMNKKLKIICCCGFDSIPADLGTLFVLEQLPSSAEFWKDSNDNYVTVEGCLKVNIPGGPSGGTYTTLINSISSFVTGKGKEQRERNHQQANSQQTKKKKKLLNLKTHYSQELKTWLVPLPTSDPLIVYRSSQLNNYFNKGTIPFAYANYLQLRKFWMVLVFYLIVFLFVILSYFKLGRLILEKIGRKSGEGPTQEQIEKSNFSLVLIGKARSNKGNHLLICSVSGGDPGYAETSKMAGESCLCLLFDHIHKTLPNEKYGVVTTASGLGLPLIGRLNKAGIRFEVKKISFSKLDTVVDTSGIEKIEQELKRYMYLGD